MHQPQAAHKQEMDHLKRAHKEEMDQLKRDHKEEMDQLKRELAELKKQRSIDGHAFNLLNVLRENGDTIVVAERETRLLCEGIKDIEERAQTIYFHLSAIAKDFCQKLDEFQRGIDARGVSLTPVLPSPYNAGSYSNLVEEKEYLQRKLEDAERRLELAVSFLCFTGFE